MLTHAGATDILPIGKVKRKKKNLRVSGPLRPAQASHKAVGMKIIAAIKQVPVRDSTLRVSANGTWIDEQDLTFEINEPDAYALEEALLLKEKHGGEVVVLCAGPARAAQTIREALAKGADRAIHIELEAASRLDTLGIARVLASAIQTEKPDLILTGLQSDDLGSGQTGVVLAEMLGMPHATIIMEVERHDGAIRVKRELESGWFQWIEMPLPALLTIQSGISKLRYATLMGIKKAKIKEIRHIAASALGGLPGASVSLRRLYLPHKKKETRIISGPPEEAAARLTEILRSEVRVL
jgi:electron transfer flavoprotein beta subunit